jgi:hypothetical protein
MSGLTDGHITLIVPLEMWKVFHVQFSPPTARRRQLLLNYQGVQLRLSFAIITCGKRGPNR